MKFPVNPAAQLGQAMVEMAVISLVLIGLFLGIWYIGKFHDIQSSTIQAARYAAWERTAHGPGFSDTQLASQTRARLFSLNQNAYRSNDGISVAQAWGRQSTMWRDHAGARRLITAPRDVTVRTYSGPLPGAEAAAATSILSGVDTALAGLTGGTPLPRGGKFTSVVNVDLANLTRMPAPLNAMNLTLTERSVLVADNWDAHSPEDAAERTRAFTPGGVLKTFDDGLGSVMKGMLAIIEPSFRNFHPGQICPDVVPNDRITATRGRANQPAYRDGRTCF